jgi:hypothetical protein
MPVNESRGMRRQRGRQFWLRGDWLNDRVVGSPHAQEYTPASELPADKLSVAISFLIPD